MVLAFASLSLLVQCDLVKRLQEQQGDGGVAGATTTAASAATEEPDCLAMPCPPVGVPECDDYIAKLTACVNGGDSTKSTPAEHEKIRALRLQLVATQRNLMAATARGWTPKRGGERDHAKARADAVSMCNTLLTQATKNGVFVCEQ
jgi:hypothetical protein